MKTTPRHLVISGLVLAGSLVIPRMASSVTAAKPAAAKPAVASAKMVLPWIEDDYTRAMADAKARKVPIFVESWAPW